MSLPKDFTWGFATASYQIEGAIKEDGRLPSIWDTFTAIPGKIADGSSGVTACDSYHRTAEDIALLKASGAKCYRFSLAWTRIIPTGGRNDPINQKGIDHYVKFVDDLLEAGIEPFVTLFHWDLPEGLDARYGGLLNKEEFTQDFERYARVCFEALPKVKHWITFNEPWVSSILGYGYGNFAPGRSSNRVKTPKGDSLREGYIVGHNLLLAHGRAVKAYRDDFKPKSNGGEIGITLNGDMAWPWNPQDPKDVAAAQLKLEYAIAWFADPIYKGDYPASMKEQLGDRLPTFTKEEVALVKGSNDFYGMNTYTANYVKHRDTPPGEYDFYGNVDSGFENKAGDIMGPESQSKWLRPNAPAFRDLLNWISKRYDYPKIFVTENGCSVLGETEMTREEALEDDFRVKYYHDYVNAMALASKEDGVNVMGYMAWSLLDNFEWADGYVTRFGTHYVDYENGQKRYAKKSARLMKPLFDGLIKQ